MADIIFAEQTISGFEDSSDFGAYTPGYDQPASIVLAVGESYRVVWDGEEFNCVAFSWVFSGMDMIAIGDGSGLGASGNGEPFLINYNAAYDNSQIFGTTGGTHTVAIYTADESAGEDDNTGDGEESYNSNDAVILNYSQNPNLYEKIPKVWLTHPSSTDEAPVLVPFTYGEAVSKNVAPDFSAGDMAVPIAKGELVTELTIAKPENLLAGNIAEGVDIAGIVGTFAGGASGTDSPVKMWSKTITGVNLPEQNAQAFAQLAASSELPDWADLANIKRTYSLNSNIPIYILGMFAMTGHNQSYFTNYEYWGNIVTNVSSTASARFLGGYVGKAITASTITSDWFGTISTSLRGLCVKSGSIYWSQQGGYGVLSANAIYQLVLIKINPTP